MYCHRVGLSRRFYRCNFCWSARYRGSTLVQHPKRRNAVGDAIILISLRSIRRRICASRMETSNENTRESMRRRKSGEETHYAFTCWEECDSSSGRGGATLKDEKRTFQVANYRAGRCLVKNETDCYTAVEGSL